MMILVVDALLMAGADATTTRGDGYTHLQRAVVDRRADIGELLIRRGGADPNVRLPGGVTALHIAAALGASDVVEMLLDAGADTTAQRDDGSTPLHEAAGFGRATIARRLLTAGADITATDSSGATPLHVACDERKSDVARELLQFAAETGSCCRVVNWRDRRGGATPLMRAAWSGDAELVLVLLSVPGVDASLADDKGLNALHHASLLGHVTVVDILITSGLCDVNGSGAEEPQLTIAADVNCACVNDVTTPVHLAAENGHCDVVRLLAARGATVNAVDSAGNTPLHLAVVARQPQVVECLVELTADLRLRNNAGQTATELSRSPIIRQILMKKRSLK